MHKQYATNGLPKYYKQIIIMQYSRNEIHCEQSANTPLPPTKHIANTPQIHNSHQRNTQRTIRQA
nr:MAG TPA: hypothetical protein [Caudoviricetes sp.]